MAQRVPSFGVGFKQEVKKRYPSWVVLHPYGEVLPRRENRVTVDGRHTDRYGVPLMKISVSYGENEKRMLGHMVQMCQQILEKAGAEILPVEPGAHDPPGEAIHEHGTCRMGEKPSSSVLNKFNQAHEVPNLFVVDGSSFTTASEKNPTLTILALAWRASDYLAEELRKRNL